MLSIADPDARQTALAKRDKGLHELKAAAERVFPGVPKASDPPHRVGVEEDVSDDARE